MSEDTVREAIIGELRSQGFRLAEGDYETDLIGAGLNSVSVIRVFSALEEVFDIEFDSAGVFSPPITVSRLESEIARQLHDRIDV